MNPVDHPMGGGEGSASGGHPSSRNGITCKRIQNRAKKKNLLISILLKNVKNNKIIRYESIIKKRPIY